MPKNWRKPLIQACKTSIAELLREVEAADDLDLWEEADGKLNDVVLCYRRSQQAKAGPETFTFSDGVTRHLGVMALAHAEHAVADELADMSDEYPAILVRGEKGA